MERPSRRHSTGASLHTVVRKGGDRQEVEHHTLRLQKRSKAEQTLHLEARDPFGNTALHYAAAQGNLPVLSLLLEQGKPSAAGEGSDRKKNSLVDMENSEDGCTPLHRAAFGDFVECVGKLLECGADGEKRDRSGATPLHHAAANNAVRTIKVLVECGGGAGGGWMEKEEERGQTALHWAAANGSLDAVMFFLEYGDKELVTKADKEGKAALHLAAEAGYSQIVELLAKHSPNIDIADSHGASALHKASEKGHIDCVKALLQHKSNVNKQDHDGNTPLHKACQQSGSREVVRFLVEQANADKALLNKTGRTAWQEAILNKHAESLSEFLNTSSSSASASSSLASSATGESKSAILRGLGLDEDEGLPSRLLQSSMETPTRIRKFQISSSESENESGTNGSLKMEEGKMKEKVSSPLSTVENVAHQNKKKKMEKKNERKTIPRKNSDVAPRTRQTSAPHLRSLDEQEMFACSDSETVLRGRKKVKRSTLRRKTNSRDRSASERVMLRKKDLNENAKHLLAISSDQFVHDEEEEEEQEDKNENYPSYDIYGFETSISSSTPRTNVKKTLRWERKWSKIAKDMQKYKQKKGVVKLSSKLKKGIPDSVRGLAWQRLSQSAQLKQDSSINYQALCKQAQNTPYSKQIDLDIRRTYRNHFMFNAQQGQGQQALANILKAYSVHDTLVGYCQGMATITALLLMYMGEEDAWWVLLRLLTSYRMAGLFKPEFPRLFECFYVQDQLLKAHLPQLYKHLNKENVMTSAYATKWYMGIFLGSLPFHVVLRIWDLFFWGGWGVVFRMSLALLKMFESKLLRLSFDELMEFFLTGLPKMNDLDPDHLIKLYKKTAIKADKVVAFQRKYRAMLKEQQEQEQQEE
ncbi:Rab-GAP TBC domain-containing protein [Balamuthia mandrillaris]